jgi:pimeloyl-ACP methyl ester carboxylesterase
MIPTLSQHFKLLAIDYIGVGDSDKPLSGFSYTIEEQTDIIAKMIETLQVKNARIVGVSYGGGIALNLAARYPDKVDEIVSIEGNGFIKHKKLPYRSLAVLRLPLVGDIPIGMIRSGLIDRIIAKWVVGKAWHHMSDEEKKEILEIISQNNKTASRISWYHISRTLMTSKDFSEVAKTIRIPVLYLYGKKSEYRGMIERNIDFLKTFLPHVELVGFEDGIHNLQLQKPNEVAHLILQFLNKSPSKK